MEQKVFTKNTVEMVLCQYFTEDLISSLIEQMQNAQAESDDIVGNVWGDQVYDAMEGETHD